MQIFTHLPDEPVWEIARRMTEMANEKKDTITSRFNGVELIARPSRVPQYEAARIVVRYADTIGIK